MSSLVEALEGQLPGNVLDLARCLLLFCRNRLVDALSARQDPRIQNLIPEARRRVKALFEAIDEELIEGADVPLVKELAADLVASLGEVSAAYALAQGLEEACAGRFLGLFRRRGRQLRADDPCPVALPPLKRMFSHLCTNPDTATEPLDRLRTLCLMPRDLGPTNFEIALENVDLLASMGPDARMAVALPNLDFSELDFDRFTAEGVHRFYGVRPRNSSEQRRRVRSLLDRAAKEEISIVVFPELCADEGVVGEVRRWRVETALAPPHIVVAGSRHLGVPPGTLGHNEALALLGSKGEALSRKVRPYVLKDRMNDQGEPVSPPIERREHLDLTAPTVRIHFGGEWSFAVLICKDVLSADIVHVLEQLRVRLVLVPACSDDTELMEQHAKQLAQHAQAIVIISNLAAAGTAAASAVFGVPARGRALLVRRSEDIGHAPALCVLDTLPQGTISVLKIDV